MGCESPLHTPGPPADDRNSPLYRSAISAGAKKVQQRLQAVVGLLAEHPESGRVTNGFGLRRIVASPYPYIIFYQSGATEIVIHGVRHAARRPV